MREGVHACDKVQARRTHSGPRTLYMPQVRVRTTTALDIACSLRAKRRAAKAARRVAPLYLHTYIHVYRRMFMDFFLFSPFALRQSWYLMLIPVATWYLMLIPVATPSVFLHINIRTFIRAKRVSNCYIQEKKLTVCLSGCSANLGFSVKSANRTRPKHGIPLPV